MIHIKNLQKTVGLGIILMLVCITLGTSCTANQQAPTTLEITTIKGGFGQVSVTIKNIGTVTAEEIITSISVTGGFLGKINITKICSGCGSCNNSIEPDATKTESTTEAGKIIGFGPVTIVTSAEASNAEKVSKTIKGFILGFFVIVTN